MDGRAEGQTPGSVDFVLHYPPNWTAVWFFFVLGMLHLFNGGSAFLNGRWEGHLSLILAGVFLGASLLSWRLRPGVHIVCSARRIRLSQGIGWLRMDRLIPFEHVRSVRVMLTAPPRYAGSTIEIICDHESIECPPTEIPRQTALCMAMAMKTRLVKIFEASDGPARQTEPDMVSPPKS